MTLHVTITDLTFKEKQYFSNTLQHDTFVIISTFDYDYIAICTVKKKKKKSK